MAVELTLQNGRWGGRALKKHLEAWAPKSPIKLLTWMPWTNAPAGLRTWIFPEGAIRGVHVIHRLSLVKGTAVTVRLNAFSSHADYTVAYAFLRGLVAGRGGRVVGPDQRVYRTEDLTDEAAAGDAQSRLFEDAKEVEQGFRRGEKYAVLPSPEFDLLMTEAMLPREQDRARRAVATESMLREMAGRYQRASIVNAGTLPNGRTMAVWSMDDALLDMADFVGVRQGSEAQDGVVLSATQAMGLLGNRFEVVSEDIDRFFIPAIDPSEAADRTLAKRLFEEGTPITEFLARFQRQAGGVG